MVVLVFITYSGLCNQFYDIDCGINFCLANNIKFTFKYCSYRNKNMVSWYNSNFENLFDTSFIKLNELYIDYKKLNLNKENTYNLEQKRSIEFLIPDKNLLDQILAFNKEYVILKQFWPIFIFDRIKTCYSLIKPSTRLLNRYNTIKNNLLKKDEKYNCIHYRYEVDFVNYFKIKIDKLLDLILKLKTKFNDKNLRIFILTSNIKKLININDPKIKNLIVFKNDDNLQDLNYEEKAFIDYMFGLNAVEIYGHNKSSFSVMLNDIKNTQNYYNI